MPTDITDSNREALDLMGETIHQMSHDLHQIRLDLTALRAAWDTYEPVVSAFRRGGVLAARTAARNGRRHDGHAGS
jgi:hypothetical protein